MWKAVYDDGTFLPQYNEDGSTNKYPDIDRSKLVCFILFNDGKVLLKMNLSKNQRLIFRKRIRKNMRTGEDIIVYLVGWQMLINNVSVKHIHLVFSDGSIETIPDWSGDRLYCSPNLLECEKLNGY